MQLPAATRYSVEFGEVKQGLKGAQGISAGYGKSHLFASAVRGSWGMHTR